MSEPALFQGRWRIASTTLWAREALDLLGPAFLEFDSGGGGRIQFIAITGDLDCRFDRRDGLPLVDFSWQGHEEREVASGRGWAVADGDELQGRIYIHNADDAAFQARRIERVPEPVCGMDEEPVGAGSTAQGEVRKPVSLPQLVSEVEGLMFDWHACVNVLTGEIGTYSDDPAFDDLPDDADPETYDGPEWLHVPYPDEDSDWRMMRDFASEQTAEGIRDALWRALDGRKPFRTFRALVFAQGLEKAWYAHEQVETERLLRSWLELNRVPLIETMPATPVP